MSFVRAREFLLGTYHDLPNVLFTGSLILGSIMGYLPLVWVSLGLILNGASVAILQGVFSLLFPTWNQVSVASGSTPCEILGLSAGTAGSATTVVAPSHWLSAATFFAVFSIYNSIQVALKPPAAGANQEKIDVRRAFSLSVMVIGVVFLTLVMARGFSGCETWLGSITGVLIGGGLGIGYWYLLDACGTGSIPDVLQVVHSLPPPGGSENIPVICTPPPST
jgi:hypothetical protein